ncbi:MAG: DUF2339 domain-containing protein [Pseudorhodobacter sp.]
MFGGIIYLIADLLILGGILYLLISQSRLKRRIRTLEGQLSTHRPAPGPDMAQSPDTVPRPAAATGNKVDAELGGQSVEKTAPIPRPQVSEPAPPDDHPHAFVFSTDKLQALGQWLRGNWPLALAGLSLALAGVFMVQYGVENGLLTPFWRVMGALGLGAALITGGEVIRRRHGDDTDEPTRFLPSTLSAAGLIALFAGILAARGLYGLIGPGPAMAGLVLVAAFAIVLGWFHGPVLTAGGIIGATAAPFLVGGSSDTPWFLYYYFALVALAGLAVDTVKRWAWVSALVLIATIAAAALIYAFGAGGLHFLIFLLIITAMALTIPERSPYPAHGGTSLLGMVMGRRPLPDFPTRIAIGVIPAAAIGGATVMHLADTAAGAWQAVAMLSLMLAAALIWLRGAPALADLTLAPALALLVSIAGQAGYFGPLYTDFLAVLDAPPETSTPLTITILLAIAAVGSGLGFWRMQRAAQAGDDPVPAILWAIGAACYAPVAVLFLEFAWQPGRVLGSYGWALHAIAIAAGMTLLAERTVAGPDLAERPLRAAGFAVSALTMIALALFLLLSGSALTLALSVMVLGVAFIDRRHDLPLLGWFIQLAIIVIAYRLIVYPGLIWAVEATLPETILAYGGTLALLGAGWVMLERRAGDTVRIVVESGIWTLSAVFACVLLFQILDEERLYSHWGAGLIATVWFASAANQAYRLRAGGRFFRILRIVLAAVFAFIGLIFALLQATWFNPLVNMTEQVQGPSLLNSLAVAYLPLMAVFAVAAWRLDTLPRVARWILTAISASYAIFYVALEIRRIWQGPNLSGPGVTQPELYSYTIAMMVAALGTLLVAFWRRHTLLRRIAMAGVALTVAKVFLIDMAGLSGLIRVASFLGLGLAMAGLAWLDRKMSAQWGKAPAPPDTSPNKDPG